MPEEEQDVNVKVSVVETDEETFKPEKTVTITAELEPEKEGKTIDTEQEVLQVFAELEPEEKDKYTYYDPEYFEFIKSLYPPKLPSYEKIPEYEAPTKELIINIETTGAKPWESRLLCIGVLDPNVYEPQTLSFIHEDEEATLIEFVEWFSQQQYDTLVGYNVAFDYRFIYVLLQKYRINLPKWKQLELYDLMQQQKQVKTQYVFNYNPEGKLEEWTTFLFGLQPYAKQEQVLKWWKDKNLDEIANFNADKLVKAYYLFSLDKYVSTEMFGAGLAAKSSKSSPETTTTQTKISQQTASEYINVSCPQCMQIQPMLTTDKVINCIVCGAPIANPML